MNIFYASTITKVITNRMQSSLCAQTWDAQYVIEESGDLSDPDSCTLLFETFGLTWYHNILGLPIPSVLSLKSDELIIDKFSGL